MLEIYPLTAGNNNKHIGNEQLRNLARRNVREYRNSSKKEKSDISRSIVHHIRSLNPPGRFLKRDPSRKCWKDVGDDSAREKASQALRDAVAEFGRGDIGIIVSPMMKEAPLSPPSLPNYRYGFEVDNYKRRRMSSECCNSFTNRIEPIQSPPRLQPRNDYRHHGAIMHLPRYSYDKKPPPVVTPDDPQHWREYYSSSSDIDPNSCQYRMYPSYDNFGRNGTERSTSLSTSSCFQEQAPNHSGESIFEGPMAQPSNHIEYAYTDSSRTNYEVHNAAGRRGRRPNSTLSFVSSDSPIQLQHDSFPILPMHEKFDDLDLFKW